MAIIEFKRPLSLTRRNWEVAFEDSLTYGGKVDGPDGFIAQQAKKYVHVGKTPFVCIYDWFSFLELVSLDPINHLRYRRNPGQSKALYRWTDAQNGPVRLCLFQFLFESLMHHLGSSVEAQVAQRIQEYSQVPSRSTQGPRFGDGFGFSDVFGGGGF
jgi:hypothetical protein